MTVRREQQRPDTPPGEVHVTIDRLVVRGLSQAEARELVGELRAGLTDAFAGAPAPAAANPERPASRRARTLGRNAAQRIARAGGR